MPVTLEPLLPHVPAFLLTLFRLGGLFIFAPMFGSDIIPVRIKAMLALVLSFCVYPAIPHQLPIELSLMTLGVSIGSELLIGTIIGFGATLPLMAFQMGGVMMGQQLGMGLARVFSPNLGEQTDVFSQFFFLVAVTLFILLGGHHAMLSVLVRSFETIPLTGYRPDGSMLHVILGLLSSMFELGVRVAAPLLCLVFLQTVAMGFVARTVPQLNILSLGFPLRIILGLAIVIALIAPMHDALADFIREAMAQLMRLFGT